MDKILLKKEKVYVNLILRRVMLSAFRCMHLFITLLILI